MSDADQPGSRFVLDARCRLVLDGARLVLLTDAAAVVLRGRTTAAALAQGLSMLDGTTTQGEIAHRLGVALDPWAQVVQRLADTGLVAPAPVPGGGPDDLLTPLVDTLVGSAADADGARAPSGGARLHLRGRNTAVLDALAEVWVASGGPPPTRGDEPAADDALWVHAATSDDELAATNDLALEQRRPWLQLPPFDGEVLLVGPVHVPGQTCCAQCVRIRRAANAPYERPTRASRLLAAPRLHRAPVVVQLQAALAATLAATYTLRPERSAVGTVHALELASLRSTRHRVLRVPRCPACSGAAERAIPYPWTRAAGAAS